MTKALVDTSLLAGITMMALAVFMTVIRPRVFPQIINDELVFVRPRWPDLAAWYVVSIAALSVGAWLWVHPLALGGINPAGHGRQRARSAQFLPIDET